jgi:heavy metal efflux system protein
MTKSLERESPRPQKVVQEDGLLEKLVEGALKARVLLFVITVLATFAGIYALLNLRIDAVPDISNIQVTVTTNARGLAPQEVEQYVTYPVEQSLQGMSKLTQLRSISKYALSQVTVVFEDGTDIYWARQQVSERLGNAMESIPKSINAKMALGPLATGLGEVYQFEVRGSGYSLMQLRDILDWQVIPILKSVPGVDEVQAMGGQAKEYQVWLEPEKMHGFHVTVTEVMDALQRNNANAGGGYSVENGNQVLLRSEGMLHSLSDIGNVMVKRTAGGTVRVSDLGKVVEGKKLSQSVVTQNGNGETVIGIVLMRKGENSS